MTTHEKANMKKKKAEKLELAERLMKLNTEQIIGVMEIMLTLIKGKLEEK